MLCCSLIAVLVFLLSTFQIPLLFTHGYASASIIIACFRNIAVVETVQNRLPDEYGVIIQVFSFLMMAHEIL
jgi:hypothetical protein